MKKTLAPMSSTVHPKPNVIVSCRDKDGRNNALAIGFAANVSIVPPMVMVAITPLRHSHGIIKESGEFVLNLPVKGFEKEYEYLGTHSGRDGDKLAAMVIEWEEAEMVSAPMLCACPVCVECRVVDSIKPGSHELFVGEVLAVHCEEKYVDKNGKIRWDELELL